MEGTSHRRRVRRREMVKGVESKCVGGGGKRRVGEEGEGGKRGE